MRAVRQALGLSQEKFARLLNVSVKTVTRWESGETRGALTLEQWLLVMGELTRLKVSLKDLHEQSSLVN